MDESFDREPKDKPKSSIRSHLINPVFDERVYETDDSYRMDPKRPKSTREIAKYLVENEHAKIDARILASDGEKISTVKYNTREAFLDAFKKNEKSRSTKRFTEAFQDTFGTNTPSTGDLVGDDFVPLLGGPFNKQLYIYDALRMFALGFFAYHHDPFARCTAHIIRDFTLGRGFRVDSDNKAALSLWRAFEEVNQLQAMMDTFAVELSVMGEDMFWWLPNHDAKVMFNQRPGDEVPKSMLPRVRFIDPSTCWEIITYPDDITRVLAYQLVFPTQYQMYTTKDPKTGKTVPMTKFVIQQIPADQVDHIKINCFNNEKRGRSDLFPAFGYMKRLRDSVNYSIIAMQKASAWAIDTEIDGNQADIDSYAASQQAIGTIAPAGSEFVHSTRVKRNYLSNSQGGKATGNTAFDWSLTMAAMAVGIPISYYGTHMSGGQTRASALVATEPVAKKFQQRQLVYERVIHKFWDRLMKDFGIDADCEVTFPEVIVQDRSQKIKDVLLAKESGAISEERASTIIAKELGISEYEWESEQQDIKEERAEGLDEPQPLTADAQLSGEGESQLPQRDTAVTSKDRREIALSKGY